MTSAWLIEKVDGTAWLGRGCGKVWRWTAANEAIRFARYEDAHNAAFALQMDAGKFQVTEHEWPEDKPVAAYVPPSRDDEPKAGDPKWASWLFDRVFNHGAVALTVDDWRRLMHTIENLEAAATANALAPNELLEQTRARCDYLEAKMDRQRSEIAKLLAAKESLRSELRRSKSNKETDPDPADIAMSQVTEADILEGEQQVREGDTIALADLRDEVSASQQETAWLTDREELSEKQSFDFLHKESDLYVAKEHIAVDDAVLAEAILCAESWEPDVRLLGNVKASEMASLLVELQQRRLNPPVETSPTDEEIETAISDCGDASYDCGQWQEEDEADEPYTDVLAKANAADDRLRVLIRRARHSVPATNLAVEKLRRLVVEADKMTDFWLRLFSAQPHRRMVYVAFGTQIVEPLVEAIRAAKEVLS